MRYLGNKSKLLNFIDSVVEKYHIKGNVFCDLFAGTGSVGDYFKNRYQILSNDYMYFSYVINSAKLLNKTAPSFSLFKEKYNKNPYEYLNSKVYTPNINYFLYNNYTNVGSRMYFTEENAIKIDGMRLEIEELYKNEDITKAEYMFLIASLIDSVMGVSNTAGTYQAFFKFWDTRALKTFEISPIEIVNSQEIKDNIIYNMNSNDLVRKISGDIVYIDPPYTTTQYTNSYHILETIAKYDYPDIFGKTGRRVKRELSNYSNKNEVLHEFEDLFRQLDFKYVMISYSNQSLIPLAELIKLASKFAKNNHVDIEYNEYREYATNNISYKSKGEKLKEAIIIFEKDNTINKSPLNYSGSKDSLLSKIYKELPKHISTFVDAMGGAFNVGANVVAMDKVFYNEYNNKIYELMNYLVSEDKNVIINDVHSIVDKFNMKKKDKEAYLALRNYYNYINPKPSVLYTLHIYAFQNMIRMNSKGKINTPVGNNEFCSGNIERINNFIPKTSNIVLNNKRYQDINIDDFDKDTIFYFDPPYFITNAEYNDGKRGLDGWTVDNETELLSFLIKLDKNGYKFMLSNVLYHNGKTHNLLVEWINEHGFKCVEIGKTGIKYPRIEVLIKNY